MRALKFANSVDVIEFGTYVCRVATAPLAVSDRQTDRRNRPVLARSGWPLMVRDRANLAIPDASFMASVARREEKGSDVNVAAHLLLDVLGSNVDAAVVVSNDSDLKLAIREARDRVPVGLVNPTAGYPASSLNGQPTAGVGSHWWYQLTSADFGSHQLPAAMGSKLRRPSDW